MSEQAANRPAGKLTEIFRTVASREGAYKFIENEAIKEAEVARAAHHACAKRCAGESFVFVPVDQSTLSFKDPKNIRSVGPVGARYQLDRGADFREMLLWAAESQSRVTVRASQDRCVKHEETKYLWETLEAQKPVGIYRLDVSQGPNRQARIAHMQVRATQIEFKLRDNLNKKTHTCKLYAVLASEFETAPNSETSLEWLLITNYEVRTFEDACLVVFGYTIAM
jgi:hypothetical protein